jgi:hypothetical protein
MQTFRIIDVDEACAEMDELTALGMDTALPEITEYHPVMIAGDGTGAIVCAHDTANGSAQRFMLPIEFIEGPNREFEDEGPEEFFARVSSHLQRLSRAVYN